MFARSTPMHKHTVGSRARGPFESGQQREALINNRAPTAVMRVGLARRERLLAPRRAGVLDGEQVAGAAI
jgi:hypothetical protein